MKKYCVMFSLNDSEAIGSFIVSALNKKDAKEKFLKKNIPYKEILNIKIW